MSSPRDMGDTPAEFLSRLPPYFSGLDQTRSKAEDKHARALVKAETLRRELVESLGLLSIGQDEHRGYTETGIERRAVTQLAVNREYGSELLAIPTARGLRRDWLADPKHAAGTMRQCSKSWGIIRRGESLGAIPFGCGSALCPVCMHHKASKRVHKWAGLISGLVEEGYRVVHVTLTQPIDLGYDVPVGFVGPLKLGTGRRSLLVGEDDATGAAVRGEPLGMALDRYRASLTGIRDSRARTGREDSDREFWKRSVAGYIYGIEWTGGDESDPRWHVHGHLLLVLRPSVRLAWDWSGKLLTLADLARRGHEPTGEEYAAASWWSGMVERWCRHSSGNEAAQHARVVADLSYGGGASSADMVGAVREVLKYPFKPGDLTTAQLGEVLVTAKGRRFHLPGGVFHGSSRVGKRVRSMLEYVEAGDNRPPPPGMGGLTVEQIETVHDLYDLRLPALLEDPSEAAALLWRRVEEGACGLDQMRKKEIAGRVVTTWKACGAIDARWVPVTLADLKYLRRRHRDRATLEVARYERESRTMLEDDPLVVVQALARLRDLPEWLTEGGR